MRSDEAPGLAGAQALFHVGDVIDVGVDIIAEALAHRGYAAMGSARVAEHPQMVGGLLLVAGENGQKLAAIIAFRLSQGVEVMPNPVPGIDRARAVGGEDEAIAEAGSAFVGRFRMSAEPKRNRPPWPRIYSR